MSIIKLGHLLLGTFFLELKGGVIIASLHVLFGALQLFQDCMPDGYHHGCGGCVANPHGEEGCDQHEAQKQQGRPHSDDKKHLEGNAFVQVPVFYSNGHHQPPDEQYVGVLEVLYADLRGIHDAHQREEDDGEEGSDSQGQGLGTPQQRHEDDGVSTVGFLSLDNEWQRQQENGQTEHNQVEAISP